MSYLPEVVTGQFYLIDGVEFELIKIRATNVVSHNDYIIGVTFKNETDCFDTRLEDVIKGDNYKLIK